jgi:hypothetical protein
VEKQAIHAFIYSFVARLHDHEEALKITGLLVDLGIDEIKKFLQNYELFKVRVAEAAQILTIKEAEAKMPPTSIVNSEPSQSPKETQEGSIEPNEKVGTQTSMSKEQQNYN